MPQVTEETVKAILEDELTARGLKIADVRVYPGKGDSWRIEVGMQGKEPKRYSAMTSEQVLAMSEGSTPIGGTSAFGGM